MRTLLLTAMACTLLLCSTSFASVANHPAHVTRYIDNYYEIAIREMHRSGIPASVILAQGILESSWGMGELSANSNNHFGIKCKSVWTGPTFYIEDDDVVDGVLVKSCFRVYGTVEESYIDHTNFLLEGTRYATLFNYPRTDYKNWATGLKSCGYATDPEYANKLITTIEKYNLAQYDQVVPPVVSAPVFHIPGVELIPQTVRPQVEDYSPMENYGADAAITSALSEETPPAAVNIEGYNINTDHESTDDDAAIGAKEEEEEEEDHDEDEEEEETARPVKKIKPQSGVDMPAANLRVNQTPEKQKTESELSANKQNINTSKSDDNHLQLMKGNLQISRKPRT
jgi:Mannosyl-glycoprotein endo-beta-N-acetylglucosaminidase